MLLTGKETAKRIGISYATFNNWKKYHPENLPPAVRFNGGVERYDESDIQSWINSHKTTQEAAVLS